jgi:hypothetical protein
MMQRRSFLGAMLAAMVAPAVVKASSLMPIHADRFKESDGGLLVPKEFSDMEIGRFESMRVINDSIVKSQGVLELFSAGGTLLATMSVGAVPGVALDSSFSGRGNVIASGIADNFRVNVGGVEHAGKVSVFGQPGDLQLSNDCVCAGQLMSVAGRFSLGG